MMGGLLVAVMLPFAGALLLPVFVRPRSIVAGWLASVFALVSFLAVAWTAAAHLYAPAVLRLQWIPQLGIGSSLLADGLSLTMGLVISGIGAIIFAYAAVYLGEEENRRRFFCYLLFFMGSMLGVVFAADLIGLFVFWELTSVSSFLLIGFWHRHERSRQGALKALIITSAGGLAMFAGLVLVGIAGSSFHIPDLLLSGDALADSPLAVAAAVLIMAGVLTKSAQLPFHLWLPGAMEAPTPVSAYLHAATMVKAGLYLVARLGPLMTVVPFWEPVLTTVGLVTMVWGGLLALRQRDLKALLAFSTISQLGLILSMFAAAKPEATAAGMLHLLNHAAFKGSLFLLVGVIEHQAHTRDLTRLGPLAAGMPRTWVLIAASALAMAGLPPFGGFVSKEMFLDQALGFGPLLAAVAVVGAVVTAAYSFVLVLGLARGWPGVPAASQLRDPSAGLLWGPALLSAVALALGLAPGSLAQPLIESSTAAALGPTPSAWIGTLELKLWHGATPSLAVSALVIAAGLAAYLFLWRRFTLHPPRLLADRLYERFLADLESRSKALTSFYMSGLLWRYSSIILAVSVGGAALAMAVSGLSFPGSWPAREAGAFDYIAAFVVATAAVLACVAKTRLTAILSLGASGYSLALLFALLGAPDLVLTQIMVETVSVALFLAVFVFLPPFRAGRTRRFEPFRLLLSAATGLGVAGLLFVAVGRRVADPISGYFVENAVGMTGGHNVVNVILVDFRGLDTLGEITVLGVAALACYAVIKARPDDEAL